MRQNPPCACDEQDDKVCSHAPDPCFADGTVSVTVDDDTFLSCPDCKAAHALAENDAAAARQSRIAEHGEELVRALTNSVRNHCGGSAAYCSTCSPARVLLATIDGDA